MEKFIEKPFKDDSWDPSKGDFINEHVIQQDRFLAKKKKKKKTIVILLAFSHILLLTTVLLFY